MLQHIHVRHCKLRLLISVQFSLSDISVNDIVLVGYFTNEDLLAYTWRHRFRDCETRNLIALMLQ